MISILTIGSSSAGRASRNALRKAVAAAVLNACSELSTAWYLPKKTSTSTSTTGLPEITPFSSCSRTPFSTAGMNWFGIDAALDRVDEVEPLAARPGPDPELDVGELAAAAGLLLVAVVGLGRRR